MPVQVVLRTKTELYEILYGPDNGDALKAVRPSVSKSAVGHLPHTRARTRSRSDRVAVIDRGVRGCPSHLFRITKFLFVSDDK